MKQAGNYKRSEVIQVMAALDTRNLPAKWYQFGKLTFTGIFFPKWGAATEEIRSSAVFLGPKAALCLELLTLQSLDIKEVFAG